MTSTPPRTATDPRSLLPPWPFFTHGHKAAPPRRHCPQHDPLDPPHEHTHGHYLTHEPKPQPSRTHDLDQWQWRILVFEYLKIKEWWIFKFVFRKDDDQMMGSSSQNRRVSIRSMERICAWIFDGKSKWENEFQSLATSSIYRSG